MENFAVSPLDYGRSYIFCPGQNNRVRFQIESRTLVVTPDRTVQLYQCCSCKAENTFASEDLFQKDNYDFLPVFSSKEVVVFRRYARLTNSYRTLYDVKSLWNQPIIFQPLVAAEKLSEYSEIKMAAETGIPLVGRTIIMATERTRLIVEYPIKTLNIHPEKPMLQVDTGPFVVPEFRKNCGEDLMNSLSLAYVAWNNHEHAEFIFEKPTRITESVFAYHYSDPKSELVQNEIYRIA